MWADAYAASFDDSLPYASILGASSAQVEFLAEIHLWRCERVSTRCEGIRKGAAWHHVVEMRAIFTCESKAEACRLGAQTVVDERLHARLDGECHAKQVHLEPVSFRDPTARPRNAAWSNSHGELWCVPTAEKGCSARSRSRLG